MVELDLGRPGGKQVAGLPRPREVLELLPSDAPRPDLLEDVVLLACAALVEEEQPAPRRALLVVAVAGGQDDSQIGQVQPVGLALDDLPAECAVADPVCRAATRHTVDPPAGAGRVAVAGFDVRAGYAP